MIQSDPKLMTSEELTKYAEDNIVAAEQRRKRRRPLRPQNLRFFILVMSVSALMGAVGGWIAKNIEHPTWQQPVVSLLGMPIGLVAYVIMKKFDKKDGNR